MEKILTQMGAGTKQLTERYTEYAPPVHEQHVYYAYEPPSEPTASSKHHYGGGHKSNAAMSALTLLAFLFFLHILQQCVKEHMNAMSTPQLMIMTAGRDDEITLKTDHHHKLDKTGATQDVSIANNGHEHKHNRKSHENKVIPNEHDSPTDNQLMKISATVHVPKNGIRQYNNDLNKFNSKSTFPGFVNAMTDEF